MIAGREVEPLSRYVRIWRWGLLIALAMIRRHPLRGRAAVHLEQSQPDFVHGGVGGNGVPDSRQRHLRDDCNSCRLQQFAHGLRVR